MTDRHWYLRTEPAPSLRYWILGKMTTGAMYGALVFLAVLAFVLVFKAIGGLLPPESKEAPDPLAAVITAPLEGVQKSA